jgi:hypothetical protein
MLGTGFARQIIAVSADGQPQFVAVPVHSAADVFAVHPVAWNVPFAMVQLLLGVGLLVPRDGCELPDSIRRHHARRQRDLQRPLLSGTPRFDLASGLGSPRADGIADHLPARGFVVSTRRSIPKSGR